jgi:hypothetical protein
MPAKAVVITELKMGKAKNGEYPIAIDQDKILWRLFPPLPKVELNRCYAFHFEVEGEYSNVKSIEPLVNVFKREALKEVANRNDIKRDAMMCISYSKDLLIASKIEPTELFTFADKIYVEVNAMVDKYLPKEGD